jgi:hypothetical protein
MFERYFDEHGAALLLLLLLCADLAFILLHSLNALTPLLDEPLLSVERDNSYPELYQWLKWFWIIILWLYVAKSKRSFSYIAWGLVFTYFLLDDALTIHENVGRQIADNLTLTPPLGLRLQDLGELAVWAVAGMILSLLVAWAYWRGSQAFKKMSRDMLLLIIILVFFGVVFDMVQMAVDLGDTVHFILGLLDDGGEMLVGSLILWYVFLLAIRHENDFPYLIRDRSR